MKKTIIAASIAAIVAAPAAFADVKISGMVAAEYSDENDATGTFGETFTDLVFSGSEDLGNGLTASWKYHMYHDNGGSNTEADNQADHTVGLSGDFGSVKAGRMELLVEGVMDATANIEGINTIDLEGTGFADGGRAASTSTLQYTSPSMNGFSVAASARTGATEGDDVTEIMATYSNAGLTVRVASAETDSDGASYDGIAVTYKMGDLELRALSNETKTTSSATANDYDMIGAKYTMGSNTISVGVADDGTTDTTLVALTHALSKNTSAYIGYHDSDAAGTSSDVKTTVLGLATKF
jgi:predicted porin